MVQIVTRATRRQYLRPPPGGPFALNLDSPLARGLQAWWPLNHQGRFAYQMVGGQPGGRYDLTLTGTLAQREGPNGGLAHTCSGTQYFTSATGAFPVDWTAGLTMGSWFNPNATNVRYVLMALSNNSSFEGYMLQADGSGSVTGNDNILAMDLNVGTAYSERLFVASRWQHALGVFKPGHVGRTAFLDGNPGLTQVTTSTRSAPDTVALGLEPYGGFFGSNLAGLLGDCCIWSRALSEADAMRLYDPATRWELYYPLGRKDYSFPGGAAAGGTTVTPGAAALTLTTYAPTVSTPVTCTPGPASLTLTTFAPTVSTPVTCTPGAASLTLTTYAPTVSTPRTATPGAAALTLTTYAPTVSTPVTATPGTASLTLTAYAPTVSTPRTVTPGTASLTLTTYAPTVSATGAVTATPGAAALTLTTYAPTVATPRTVTPGAASLTLTTYAPNVQAPRTCAPGAAALALTLYAPTVSTPRTVTPGAAALSLTTYAPAVTAAGTLRLYAAATQAYAAEIAGQRYAAAATPQTRPTP